MIDSELDIVREMSPENKRTVAIEAIKNLPTENRQAVAAEVAKDLEDANKKAVAVELGQDLSSRERADLIRQLRPSQPVTDLVWKVTVISFAIVFVVSAVGLVAAAFMQSNDIELLLTVVTTIAGFLAGFVSGKSDA
ncbi:MAG: hypothetical protein ACRDSJ_24620 [Rubrobacteraceae bacterium]